MAVTRELNWANRIESNRKLVLMFAKREVNVPDTVRSVI